MRLSPNGQNSTELFLTRNPEIWVNLEVISLSATTVQILTSLDVLTPEYEQLVYARVMKFERTIADDRAKLRTEKLVQIIRGLREGLEKGLTIKRSISDVSRPEFYHLMKRYKLGLSEVLGPYYKPCNRSKRSVSRCPFCGSSVEKRSSGQTVYYDCLNEVCAIVFAVQYRGRRY